MWFRTRPEHHLKVLEYVHHEFAEMGAEDGVFGGFSHMGIEFEGSVPWTVEKGAV